MPFLDNLLSNLIRRSTGFNAKPFVRMVGGRNVLLLGGAAIAGALAAEQMREKPSPAAPPPPPLPPEALPPLPPLPGTAEAPPPIPQELLFVIVRTMVSGALADGEMHESEQDLIGSRLGESGLSPEQAKQIRKDLVFPPPPEELARSVASPEDRELLYRFGALVVLAEGSVSDAERTWLERLGSALGLPPAKREALEKEIFPAT
jgi:uncharacterized membrane protein YebE (DUF533 family)